MEQLRVYLEILSILETAPTLYEEVLCGSGESEEVWQVLLEVEVSVHKALAGFAGEKQNIWGQKSEEFLKDIHERCACGDRAKEWIALGEHILGEKLAHIIYESKGLDLEDAVRLIALFERSGIEAGLKAAGIYGTACLMDCKAPLFCYENALKAFQTYPELAALFKSTYIYQEESLQESYYEECPICGSRESAPYYCARQLNSIGSSNLFSPVKLWKKCGGCGNLYAYNFPVRSMGKINGHYTRDFSAGHILPRYSLRVFSDIIHVCREYTSGNRYFEVGIGRGEMLAAALEMGFEVDAVEICEEDCRQISAILDVDIKWADFLEYESTQKYDIIVMGDVLEHVSAPVKALEKAKGLLADDGVLWLSTPNYNSGFSRLMGFKDVMWNEKNHLTYFSYETLVPILEQLGLCVRRYDISERYNGSMELFIQKKERGE